jgi:phosphate starvation-inducible protein PhoH
MQLYDENQHNTYHEVQMSVRNQTRKQRRNQMQQIENVLTKKFSMKKVSPITKNQEKMANAFHNGNHIAAIGSAGTGKTYLALSLAFKAVIEEELYERVIIIRSAVQSRDQGFMPGSLTEKMAYYETPYLDIACNLFGRGDAYSILKQKNTIQFMSTSFVRGLTFDNAIIVVDEIQNMTYEEIRTIVTRLGDNSRLILCGDVKQDDLKINKNRVDISGLTKFLSVVNQIHDFRVVNFTTDDIVRSGFVKDFIISEEKVLEAA